MIRCAHLGKGANGWLCPGGHARGQDVVGVPVEVLAGPVVAHGGSRIGVAGGDLHVAQADAGVEHGGDEGVAQHVRVHPGHPDPGDSGEVFESAGGRVPVHPRAVDVAQDRTALAAVDGSVDGSGYRRRERDENDLAAFADHAQDAVAVFFAEVADVGAAGFEDP
jgi:hypothetical protein